MTARELRKTYLEFFKDRNHKVIPSASLVPQNDPTVLFTTAGMHPLVPFLLGEPHPEGKRLVNVQKCLRTDDIDEVGDTTHNTFFEMLGNWSLGDYFKRESITLSFEFITIYLKIPIEKISVTVFAGDKDAPLDQESKDAWLAVGIPKERIYQLPKKDNWWGPVGKTGPCGPDTEIFVDIGQTPCGKDCRPGCYCGKYFEIWNNVFMEYNKKPDGGYEKLKQQNVDTGMGVERTTAILEGTGDIFKTELFLPLTRELEKITGQSYENKQYQKSMRIIADHVRAACFVVADGVTSSNVEHGYILRRLLRRAIRHLKQLGAKKPELWPLAEIVVNQYSLLYTELSIAKKKIELELKKEETKFIAALGHGLQSFSKLLLREATSQELGELAFDYFQTYGFPPEMFLEELKVAEVKLDEGVFLKSYDEALHKHQDLSRTATAGMFKSGLADNSYAVTKYNTATHLLQAALRQILGPGVSQKGSNLTAERLRFDFAHGSKLSPEEIKQVEDLVNVKIKAALPVTVQTVSLEEARKMGATMLFNEKYGDNVKIYTVDDFSREACAGPHVQNTKELGRFKIVKEEAVSAGVRRIKATLE